MGWSCHKLSECQTVAYQNSSCCIVNYVRVSAQLGDRRKLLKDYLKRSLNGLNIDLSTWESLALDLPKWRSEPPSLQPQNPLICSKYGGGFWGEASSVTSGTTKTDFPPEVMVITQSARARARARVCKRKKNNNKDQTNRQTKDNC